MKQILKSALARAGLELARTADRQSAALADLTPADRELIARVEPFTMTSLDRRASLLGAIDHIVRHGIAGDIVECGVWRGGSMMPAALTLHGARRHRPRPLPLRHLRGHEPSRPPRTGRTSGESAAAQLRAHAARRGRAGATPACDDVRANLRVDRLSRASASTSSRARSRTRSRATLPDADRPAPARHRLVRVDPARAAPSLPAAVAPAAS